MPTRNTQVKTARTRTAPKEHIILKENTDENKINALDFLRFGESYTSLILGIIVVVIATILLLSFVRTKNMLHKTIVATHTTQKMAIKNETKKLLNIEQKNKTIAKNKAKIEEQQMMPPTITGGNVYTVRSGDSLWTIAEQQYKSGYNWVDIAKANNLTNPGTLYAGMKLTLPKVTAKLATAPSMQTVNLGNNNTIQEKVPNQAANQITGTSYTIQKGDNLWSIAVRAYGDGYQWTKIAKANNLTNPGLINVGNSLFIPRG